MTCEPKGNWGANINMFLAFIATFLWAVFRTEIFIKREDFAAERRGRTRRGRRETKRISRRYLCGK